MKNPKLKKRVLVVLVVDLIFLPFLLLAAIYIWCKNDLTFADTLGEGWKIFIEDPCKKG